MMTQEQVKAVLGDCPMQKTCKLQYARYFGIYHVDITDDWHDGVTITGTVQTLDELTYVVQRMVEQLHEMKGDQHADASGPARQQPAETMETATEPVSA